MAKYKSNVDCIENNEIQKFYLHEESVYIDRAIEEAEKEYKDMPISFDARKVFMALRKKHFSSISCNFKFT